MPFNNNTKNEIWCVNINIKFIHGIIMWKSKFPLPKFPLQILNTIVRTDYSDTFSTTMTSHQCHSMYTFVIIVSWRNQHVQGNHCKCVWQIGRMQETLFIYIIYEQNIVKNNKELAVCFCKFVLLASWVIELKLHCIAYCRERTESNKISVTVW